MNVGRIFLALFTLVLVASSSRTDVTLTPRAFIPLVSNERTRSIVGAETDGHYSGVDRTVYQGALGWARITSFDWWSYEPVSGTINFDLPGHGAGWAANAKLQMADAVSDGVTPIIVIRTVPAWASLFPATKNGAIKPQNYIDFAHFVDAVIDYLPMVKHFEMFNEPELAVYDQYGYAGAWPDPIAYVNMLKVVYPYIKARHPDVQIISGGISGSPGDPWMTAACGAGLANYADIVAFHSYQDSAASLNLSHYRTMQLRALVGNKPIMMSEGALVQWNGIWSPALEAAQIAYINESVAYAKADGLVAFIWFRTQPFDWWMTGLTTNGVINNVGIALREAATR